MRLGLAVVAVGILPGRWLDRYGYHERAPTSVKDYQVALWTVVACILAAFLLLVVGQVAQRRIRLELLIPFTILAYLAWVSLLAGTYRYA